jgi:hypothetical protein
MTRSIFFVLFWASALSSLKADLIIQPLTPTSTVAADATSTLAGLVNGVGLSATLTTGTNAATALTATHGNGIITEAYASPPSGTDYFVAGTVPVLTFALGGTFNDVNSVVLWNYPIGGTSPQNNSLQTFSLQFYSDTGATTQVGSTLTGLTIARSLPTSGTGSGPQIAQQVFFPGGIDFDGIAAVRMTLTDNYAGAAGGIGGDRVGFSEVRFTQVQAIPEPATLSGMLLLMGAGFTAQRMRKRRV